MKFMCELLVVCHDAILSAMSNRWRLIIAICAERGRFAAYTYSRECASTGGAIYLAIISCQIYKKKIAAHSQAIRKGS